MSEERDCPVDCPNRSRNQMGKGYSYAMALVLTLFLAGQSIRFKATNDGWEVNLDPIPIQVYVPGIAVIASVLGLRTDGLMQAFGILLSGKKEGE